MFCKLGKDRTGLMAALVLAACGATKDEIISDYNRWAQRQAADCSQSQRPWACALSAPQWKVQTSVTHCTSTRRQHVTSLTAPACCPHQV